MSRTTFRWRDYRYFPYEEAFAKREVLSLYGEEPQESNGELHLCNGKSSSETASRLTYFSEVTLPHGKTVVPTQARLEATILSPKSRRQGTRYSSHSLHEYKGRYNPQVVRSIGNILGLGEGSWILDPFCGSGTTLVESCHAGWNAAGLDLNPLAVKIANAKLAALKSPAKSNLEALGRIRAALGSLHQQLSHESPVSDQRLAGLLGASWQKELPSFDYLSSWFPLPVLGQAVALLRVIADAAPSEAHKEIMEVLLSDQLREVSFQNPKDLRIRRRRNALPNYPLCHLFFAAAEKRLQSVERAKLELGPIPGTHLALRGDLRSEVNHLTEVRPSGFDAVIASPPYVSALPYVDTQRLSLVLLNLLGSEDLRPAEKDLIGARELNVTERRRAEGQIRGASPELPAEVLSLCRELLNAAQLPGNGFRRQNRPALVYRYFCDMQKATRSIRRVLKPGGAVALVVGANKTILGGRTFNIDTPALLGSVLAFVGFSDVQVIEMDTYQRFSLHRKNGINDEALVLASA